MSLREDFLKYQEALAQHGALEGGGLTRLLYSDEWLGALKELKAEMEEIGMEAHFDEVGNLFGTIPGSEAGGEVVSTGSHIDTVAEGGDLDGQYGIVAGLVAIKDLVREHGQPKNSLQLIALAEEEGSRFPTVFWGSNNVWGIQDNDEVMDIVDEDGLGFVDEMRRCGFDFKEDHEPAKIDRFVEIHIEQGNFLEKLNKPIGVITAITGQKRYDVKIIGQANHAGTTRMEYRKDASYAYAKIIQTSIEMAREMDDVLVVTFGRVQFTPNTVNVVPGEVDFSIDCRHPNGLILDEFAEKMEAKMKEICQDLGMEIEINRWMDQEPVPMDMEMIDLIEKETKDLGLDYEVMHSGAGHDSQIFATKVPTGMIFVPSIGGISHNIEEKTELEDLLTGIEVLKQVLYQLAY